MDLIREYIRGMLLTEAAKKPADLPDEYFIRRWVLDRGPGRKAAEFEIMKYLEDGTTRPAYKSIDDVYGYIDIDSLKVEELGPCNGAYKIGYANAGSGWGPMLYDLAMEWATSNGGGLIADRWTVSQSARKVWDYYLNNRSDVVAIQLDDRNNRLTPEDEDNCDQTVIDDVDWPDSPLSKVYRKPDDSTTRELTRLGKLVG